MAILGRVNLFSNPLVEVHQTNPQKVFLTSVEESTAFFSNCILHGDTKIYAVHEEDMIIERVDCHADVVEFFHDQEPVTGMDIQSTLTSLMKALEAGSYNAAPGNLVGGAKLEVEPLDLSGLNWVQFDEKHIMLHNNLNCNHERRTYNGFTEKYDYCEKCGAKNI